MKTIVKCYPFLLFFLTIILVGYLVALFIDHDKTFFFNEKFGFYIIIQGMHLILSLSALFLIWSTSLFDRWKKMDQTIVIVCLSVIGLWYWYRKYYKKYKKYFLSDESN